jgi:hypothetical protein
MSAWKSKYYRTRSAIWRHQRLLFPSHAEVRFIQLMGGRVWQAKRIKPFGNRQPLTIVLSLGHWLRDEKFKREVRIGKYYVDFANDIGRLIEIDGATYHMDVVADMDREIYIRNRLPGCRILRIKAYHIYNNTRKVQEQTLRFVRD